ncbi:Pimeloyl-ACP methyl ester carboxylesterase [Klenkia marina]|uniref:Pimeloyl-ACP methyl ester carboxylesterase n=1 Tax=Klenkia marina TaxID=1960309 RepID=A0A1G4XU72_9ACTN|nr:alpha/beta hydrolase [Klenkia marina]SCX44764.1 Pimeloyl-ACP methyl ester carboxylesterase [Klenkia marina]
MLNHADPFPDRPGPVVVLLPAFPLDHRLWDDVAALLPAPLRPVAVDLPGLGSTAAGEPSLQVAVDGVVELLDHLGAARAVVAGLSTGGYVAALLAGHAPDRVAALALCDTTTEVGPPDVPADRLAVAADLEQHGIEVVLDSVAEGLGPHAGPELAGRVETMIRSQDPDDVAWVCRALAARPDTSQAVRDFPGPVLLVFGEHDAPTPPAQRLAGLQELRPDAVALVVPGSGHLTALESPAAVAEALTTLASQEQEQDV